MPFMIEVIQEGLSEVRHGSILAKVAEAGYSPKDQVSV